MRIQLSDHFTYSRLLRFVFPSIVMMIFTSIYGVVDGLFVSNFIGKIPFAAAELGGNKLHPSETATNIRVGNIINFGGFSEKHILCTQTKGAHRSGCLIFSSKGTAVRNLSSKTIKLHGRLLSGPISPNK